MIEDIPVEKIPFEEIPEENIPYEEVAKDLSSEYIPEEIPFESEGTIFVEKLQPLIGASKKSMRLQGFDEDIEIIVRKLPFEEPKIPTIPNAADTETETETAKVSFHTRKVMTIISTATPLVNATQVVVAYPKEKVPSVIVKEKSKDVKGKSKEERKTEPVVVPLLESEEEIIFEPPELEVAAILGRKVKQKKIGEKRQRKPKVAERIDVETEAASSMAITDDVKEEVEETIVGEVNDEELGVDNTALDAVVVDIVEKIQQNNPEESSIDAGDPSEFLHKLPTLAEKEDVFETMPHLDQILCRCTELLVQLKSLSSRGVLVFDSPQAVDIGQIATFQGTF